MNEPLINSNNDMFAAESELFLTVNDSYRNYILFTSLANRKKTFQSYHFNAFLIVIGLLEMTGTLEEMAPSEGYQPNLRSVVQE